MSGDAAEELERFRQQWQQEVTQRAKGSPLASLKGSAPPPQINSGAIPPERAAPPLIRRRTREVEEHAEESNGEGYHDLENKDEARRLGPGGDRAYPSSRREPRSALDHYELAVERELEGSLGDSLSHYRKAYRVGGILSTQRLFIIDMNPARCGRRPHLQEQALPALGLQDETKQP